MAVILSSEDPAIVEPFLNRCPLCDVSLCLVGTDEPFSPMCSFVKGEFCWEENKIIIIEINNYSKNDLTCFSFEEEQLTKRFFLLLTQRIPNSFCSLFPNSQSFFINKISWNNI